jgi:diguanylate cyclase (GGDEF)-like protein/PAS domain S-box-containing protein
MKIQNIYIKNIYLILIMALIAVTVLGSSVFILYNVSFQQERHRLVESAQSHARLIEAVARFDLKHSGEHAFEDTLSQLREAHGNFEGFGETGEFALAALENNQIVFLLSHRHFDLNNPRPIAFNDEKAEPMKLALQGKSGSLIGLDYRGEIVLAAYEPITVYESITGRKLGVVAKIDLKEVQAPFFMAAWITAGIALFLVLIGAWAFHRITKPMTGQIEKSEKIFRDTFDHAAIGLAHVAPDGRWLRVNQALCDIMGYTNEELLQVTFQDITHPDDLEKDLHHMEQVLAGELNSHSLEKRYIRKGGSIVSAILTYSLVRNRAGKPDYFISAVEDISEKVKLEHEIIESKEKAERAEVFIMNALDSQMDTFFLFDPSTQKAIRWNKAFTDISGYTDKEVAALPAPSSYYSSQDLELASCAIQTVLKGTPMSIELALIRKDGHKIPTEYQASLFSDEKGSYKYLLSIGRDISERKITEEKIKCLNKELSEFAFRDSLTGLINRRMLDEMLDKEWSRAQRFHHPISLMMIDIDYFKDYNDYYGHLLGDECLKLVAQVLNKVSKRSMDIVARYGGEEFVIIIPEAGATLAIQLAEECCEMVRRQQLPHEQSKVSDVVTISIGVSTFTTFSEAQPSSLIAAADKLLYQAKKSGRNRVDHG